MKQHDIDTQLRRIDPAADLDRDSSGPAAQRMLTRVRAALEETAVRTPRPRLRRTVALVAAALTIGSTAAVAAGVFQPDPADVGVILDDAAEAADAHLPGWRPSLRAESVRCFYAPDRSNETPVSEFPLDQPLTRELIRTECTSGNDMVRTMTSAPDQVELCAATIPPDAYQQRLEERREPVLDGDPTKATPIFTVGLGWETTCATAQVESIPPIELRPLTDEDLQRINQVRAVEVSLRAAAQQGCLSREEAVAMADQARDHLEGHWPLISLGDRPGFSAPDCYEVWVDTWGLLVLQGE